LGIKLWKWKIRFDLKSNEFSCIIFDKWNPYCTTLKYFYTDCYLFLFIEYFRQGTFSQDEEYSSKQRFSHLTFPDQTVSWVGLSLIKKVEWIVFQHYTNSHANHFSVVIFLSHLIDHLISLTFETIRRGRQKTLWRRLFEILLPGNIDWSCPLLTAEIPEVTTFS